MATNQDLYKVYRKVMDAKAQGKRAITVNGYTFVFSEQGMCQKNARQTYEAATGETMPGKDGTAWKTYQNLSRLANGRDIIRVSRDDLDMGDFVYLEQGSVGHVGIFIDEDHMFQNTSRAGLGTTDEPFTSGQWSRFVGAFRLLPLAPSDVTTDLWGLVVNLRSGVVIGEIPVTGFHDEKGRVYCSAVKPGEHPNETPPSDITDDQDVWGKVVSLETGKVIATITPSGVDRLHGRIYVALD